MSCAHDPESISVRIELYEATATKHKILHGETLLRAMTKSLRNTALVESFLAESLYHCNVKICLEILETRNIFLRAKHQWKGFIRNIPKGQKAKYEGNYRTFRQMDIDCRAVYSGEVKKNARFNGMNNVMDRWNEQINKAVD